MGSASRNFSWAQVGGNLRRRVVHLLVPGFSASRHAPTATTAVDAVGGLCGQERSWRDSLGFKILEAPPKPGSQFGKNGTVEEGRRGFTAPCWTEGLRDFKAGGAKIFSL